MNFTKLLRFELKNFLADRTVVLALVCILAAGGYAVFHGRQTIEKQEKIIAQTPRFEAEHFQKQFEINKTDLGNLLYYLQFTTTDAPSVWAPFSIGQRDVNPFDVKVRMLTLEGQIYTSEMSNPKNLLYGNFDAAFVIVFLFPLLIIAFFHNLISADQENGVWNLLRAQPTGLGTIVFSRFLVRFGVILGTAAALITICALVFSSLADIRFIFALGIALTYLAFWSALAIFVVSFQRSSVFNALTLLGIWIFLLILAPALLNLLLSTLFPVSESFDVTVKQREGYHQKWDRPRLETMEKFYAQYPEYRSFPIPEDKFSWGWYYAMQNAGDTESVDATAKYMAKLRLRDTWTNRAGLLLPTVNAQLGFNRMAETDLESHLAYLDSVRLAHRQIREFFYPYIFRNAKPDEVAWETVPKHYFSAEMRLKNFPPNVWAIFAFALLLSGLAFRNFRQKW